MKTEYGIVDLFAGPGGLAEGFASIRNSDGSRPFRPVLSVEKESSAFATLRLRSFTRQFGCALPPEYYSFISGEIAEPDWSLLFPKEWQAACAESLRLELGSKDAIREIDQRLDEIVRTHGKNTILIGGPPCQAYSLVGRARNKGKDGYDPRQDSRHFLYKEYIRILQALMPAAFVMENVKGLLSSSVDGRRVFDQVLDDLAKVGKGSYRLIPLAPRSAQSFFANFTDQPASDFVVRSEDCGIPQSRHRVIMVGIRTDIAARLDHTQITSTLSLKSEPSVTVRRVIRGMPRLRSGLNHREDSEQSWRLEVSRLMRAVSKVPAELPGQTRKAFHKFAQSLALQLENSSRISPRAGGIYEGVPSSCPEELQQWLVDRKIRQYPNHETRGHMISDLSRYFFAALYSHFIRVSPKANDFPDVLAPKHRNWRSGKFADRFRVQLWDAPATTITSHISKDGHYFIHPDPTQCRSLTVREAARLQTFPDNYFFKGNRTQQFVQVGNAVPPLLARKIATRINQVLLIATNKKPSKSSKHNRRIAIASERVLS